VFLLQVAAPFGTGSRRPFTGFVSHGQKKRGLQLNIGRLRPTGGGLERTWTALAILGKFSIEYRITLSLADAVWPAAGRTAHRSMLTLSG